MIPDDPTGFHDAIPEPEYHAHRGSLSQSGAKVLLRSPALFRWQQDNPPERKDVFDFGTVAHKEVLGVGTGIAIIPPTSRAKADQEAHKAAKEAAHAEGKTPITEDDYAKVRAMADRLSSHKLAMRLLSEGQPEVSGFALDEETGVMRRCRFDWLGSSVLTDYKTAASSDPADLSGRYGAVKKWGYDLQAAWYLDMARQLGHPAPYFCFIFQMKEPPYSVTVARLLEDDLDAARFRIREALQRFRDCTESNRWPDPIPDDVCAVLSLNNQTFDQELIA